MFRVKTWMNWLLGPRAFSFFQAVQDEMYERVDATLGDIGVGRQIMFRVKTWMRIAPFGSPVYQVVV